jgi:hypothetical protein
LSRGGNDQKVINHHQYHWVIETCVYLVVTQMQCAHGAPDHQQQSMSKAVAVGVGYWLKGQVEGA